MYLPIPITLVLRRLRKTSIAKEYACTWNQSNKGPAIWINADTNETITHDISALLQKALPSEVYNQLDDAGRRIEQFFTLLQEQKNWLLIFDNADNIEIKFDAYLPPNATGNILFTSRNSRLSALLPSAVDIKVGRLQDNEALDMFLAIANRRDIAEEYMDGHHVPTRVAKDLDNFPLAIAQAASFLRYYSTISCTDYMQYLKDENERPALLSFSTNYENYSKTVSTTWEVSYQSLLRNSTTVNAARLLCILGFLNPAGVSEANLHYAYGDEHGRIREELLEYANILRDNLDFKRSVDTLVALALVQRTRHGFMNVHPLVHEWIRVRLRCQPDGARLNNELVTLSHAISLQPIRSIDFYGGQHRFSIFGYMKQSMYDHVRTLVGPQSQSEQYKENIQALSIETVLFLCWNSVCPSNKSHLQKELLPAHSSITMSELNDGSSIGENGFLPKASILTSTLFESLNLEWCSFYEYLSNITRLGTSAIENDFWPYTECLIAGIRCLSAISTMLATGESKIGPSSVRVDSTSSHRTYSKLWQKRLVLDLENLGADDEISQLFASWNLSHNALPETLEQNWIFTWYQHFCHMHSFLLATVNGLLWPQYLRNQLYPLTPNEIPYHDRDLYYAVHHPMVAKAWEWQASSERVAHQRVEFFPAIRTKFTRYFKAGRMIDAESILVAYLGTENLLVDYTDTNDPFRWACAKLFEAVLVTVAESMQARG